MMTRLPATGRPHDDVLSALDAYRSQDADYRAGRTWSLVYWVDEAHAALLDEAHRRLGCANGLNPFAFRSLKRMEAEVVQMVAGILHGPDSTVGTLTSGGTESLLLAVKTCRDFARARRPWVRRPNLVIPATAHPAFDKAGHLFDVRVRRVPVDERGAADPEALRRRVDRNTVMVAASAPQYPHGTVDPIPEIAAWTRDAGLPFHVDACFGGLVLPWLERLGVPMPTWDLRVEGVTSISADLHKYGYAAKGASTILYRSMELMRHQFFVSTGWSGGIYASPTLPGTRPGGPIAAAWAAMNALGEDGYTRLARGAWEAAEALRAGIRAIGGLRLLGQPHSTVVTWTSDAVDVYAVADRLQELGWGTDRQQDPPSVHLTVNASNGPQVSRYLADLAVAVERVRANPSLARRGDAAVYGLMARIPAKGLLGPSVRRALERMYAPGTVLPDLAALGEDRETRLAAGLLDRVDRVRGRLGV